MKKVITINGVKFEKVKNIDVISLVRSGVIVYEVDNNELELLDYGIDRVQIDLIYVTPINNTGL
jgi:hypothetical protein